MDIEKSKQNILNSIETIINKKLKTLSFDKTYICPIVKKTSASADTYNYTVKIENNNYTMTSKSNYSVGDKIKVKIPCNNWSNMYIDNTFENVNTGENEESGLDADLLVSEIIGVMK